MPTSTSGPVTVLEIKEGEPRDKGGTFNGSVKYLDQGDGRTAWCDLSSHLNGRGPVAGETCRLRFRHDRRTVPTKSKAGKDYDKYVDALLVVDVIRDAVAEAA